MRDLRAEPVGRWTRSPEELEAILRFIGEAITVEDASGRVVYANDAAARQVGLEAADELLATRIDDVLARYELVDDLGHPIHPDDLPGRRVLRGEPEAAGVIGFRPRDGTRERWALVQSTGVARDGEVHFVINAFRDITQLKRTEARLRLLADTGTALAGSIDYPSTLRALAEMVVPALGDWCIVDVVEGRRIQRVAVAHRDPALHAAADELRRRYEPSGRDESGVAGVIRTGRSIIVPEVTDDALRAAAADEDQLAILRRLGVCSVAIIALVARGEVLGALSLASTDPSRPYTEADRPFLEGLARRAALAVDNARLLHEANEAIRLRDDFLAMASHDMRTPLAAIVANLQLAQRRLVSSDGRNGVGRNLDNALRTTRSLNRLVGELMDVAMVRSGQRLPLEAVEYDVVAAVRELLGEHQHLTRKHRLRVVGPPSLNVCGDPARLERILDNLVNNAVKYSPDGGEVTVRIEADGDDAVAIAVTDEGIGIPAEELTRVFEPYRRGSNARALRGIGLGLAGARAVAEQVGGSLGVESVEGAGSTFTIRVPRDVSRDPATVPADA